MDGGDRDRRGYAIGLGMEGWGKSLKSLGGVNKKNYLREYRLIWQANVKNRKKGANCGKVRLTKAND